MGSANRGLRSTRAAGRRESERRDLAAIALESDIDASAHLAARLTLQIDAQRVRSDSRGIQCDDDKSRPCVLGQHQSARGDGRPRWGTAGEDERGAERELAPREGAQSLIRAKRVFSGPL